MVNSLRKYNSGLLDINTNLMEYQKSIEDQLPNALSEINEELDE